MRFRNLAQGMRVLTRKLIMEQNILIVMDGKEELISNFKFDKQGIIYL